MSSSSISANLQRIIQNYLNQTTSNQPSNQPSNRINEREPFSMNQVVQLMNQYHTIMEDYQNVFRLVILMASMEQTLQRQSHQRQTSSRNPLFNPTTTPIPPVVHPTDPEIQTSARHQPTEPGTETQTISFVDVVVEIDEPFENLSQTFSGTGENQHVQNFVSNMFQNENFRNNILRTTGITPPTNMQWYTSIINASNTAATESNREDEGLTNSQIENCTRRFVYQNGLTELLSHTCPITMEDFREGDVLLQLTECSHAFREMDLLRWFVTHSTCPVCRHSYYNFPLND